MTDFKKGDRERFWAKVQRGAPEESKLTEDDVRCIRWMWPYLTGSHSRVPRGVRNAVAREYGVTPQTITEIISRRTWRHV